MSKQTFDFSEALRRMKKGKKVRRSDFPYEKFKICGEDIIGYFANGMECVTYHPPFVFTHKENEKDLWEEVEG